MLARYHRWAYGLLYERVDELGDADYFADKGLFFKSVHGSMNHMLLVDRLWLARLQGEKTGRVNLAEALEEERTGLRNAVFSTCDAVITHVDALDEDAFDSEISYVSSAGEPFRRSRGPLIAHIVNHGTHHRGQVSAALTQCGLEAPVMDLPYFLAEDR
ncbi:MAG TPA: DinB family protein, partial [Gammaproteobacteria bacterium]